MEELNLLNILEAFNAAINEEQAWAVCYQCCKYYEAQLKADPSSCLACHGLESLVLNKDGIVTKIDISEDDKSHTSGLKEQALVQSVGVIVYQALDYGLSDDEEHQLSPPLEALIDRMTGGGTVSRKSTLSSTFVKEEVDPPEPEEEVEDANDDEGISEELVDDEEEDKPVKEEDTRLSLQDVLTVCKMHLANTSQETCHYKAVVRALVTEALELISFLEKISSHNQRLRAQPSADEEDGYDTDLKRTDWARLWMQIMKNLRKGVKLKKVDSSVYETSPSEFELTPYEVLMEDIRTRRYELKKVMVNGDIPTTVKKDAHEVILDFIRSRPPLHPMKERQVNELPEREPDVREKLMNDIKQHRTLRPTPGNLTKKSPGTDTTKQEDGTPQNARKIIKPDIKLFDSDEDEEDLSDDNDSNNDDDAFDKEDEDRNRVNKVTPSPLSPLSPLSPDGTKRGAIGGTKPLWRGDGEDDSEDTSTTTPHSCDTTDSDAGPERRHSITLMQSPTEPTSASDKPQTEDDMGITGGNIMGPHGPAGPLAGFMASYNTSNNAINKNDIPRSLQSSLECLSLTVEEVMHIRNVLTKAELECLSSRPELYDLVSKGKVCFTCKKTKFTLFGSWATKCRFCARSVCSQCSSKMRIPTEHFENIPVYTLSPSPVSPSNSNTGLFFMENNGSAPSSPSEPRKSIMPFLNAAAASFTPAMLSNLTGGGAGGSTSPPPAGPSYNSHRRRSSLEGSKPRPKLQRAQTTVRPPPLKPQGSIQGPLMSVCKDCKAMIVSIIRASRMSLAIAPRMGPMGQSDASQGVPERRPARNFHLNLKPVHQFGSASNSSGSRKGAVGGKGKK